jgi:UDP-GlcNAc:undecaprenyl-phosphate GlcNAc-1-phosphate transferase
MQPMKIQEVHLLGALALATTVLLIPALTPVARRLRLVDQPAGRKMHAHPTCLVGGIAMLITFIGIVAAIPAEYLMSDKRLYFLGSLALLTLLGLCDDYYQLSYRISFPLQIAAVMIAVLGGATQLTSLGDLLGSGPLLLGSLAIAFTVFSIVGVINAINMSDGVDGLAGSLILNSIFWMALVAHWVQRPTLLLFLIIMAGAVIGFLFFNLRNPFLRRAKVFMGNASSLPLGFSLGWFAVEIVHQEHWSVYPMTMVYILGLPLMDTVRVMFERALRGRSPFAADRMHLHHRLLDMGLSVNQVVGIKFLLAFVIAGIGVAGWYFCVPEYLLFLGFGLIFISYLIVMFWFVQPISKYLSSAANHDAL